MNQFGGYVSDKLGKAVNKVIFVVPFDDNTGRFEEVTQRYFDPRDTKMKVHGHEFPVNVKDWTRKRGNRFIQYKDWVTCANYGNWIEKRIVHETQQIENAGKVDFYKVKTYLKPNGEELQSKELAAAKSAEVAEAVAKGSKMDIGLMVLLLAAVAGLLGGIMIGYLGLPMATGQHLVPNPQPVAKLISLLPAFLG